MKFSVRGFTLVEFLVVIAIMAIIGAYTLSNYASFGEDQKLKNAALDIQSLLRQAQTNATTNTKCDTQFGVTWQVEFVSVETINLKCSASVTPQKVLPLGTNVRIIGVTSAGAGSSYCPIMNYGGSFLPFSVRFAPLSGGITLGSDDRCASIFVLFRNTKTNRTGSLVIEQGGRIYAP